MQNNKEPKYIVKWKSAFTGLEGQGNPTSKEQAEEQAVFGNERLPGIRHWVEKVKEPQK